MKTKRKKTVTTWFIYPLNKETNGAVCKELSQQGFVFSGYKRCSDGKTRFLIEAKKTFIDYLSRSKAANDFLRFKIFFRHGKYGKINEWTFRKKSKKLKRTLAGLKEIVRLMHADDAPP